MIREVEETQKVFCDKLRCQRYIADVDREAGQYLEIGDVKFYQITFLTCPCGRTRRWEPAKLPDTDYIQN